MNEFVDGGGGTLRLVSESYQTETVTDLRYPEAINETVRKLNELASLEDDWDSYGGLSPTANALMGTVQLSLDLFETNTPFPDVFPVPNGNIQLEWSCFQLDIEIEIHSNARCIVSFEDLQDNTQWVREFGYDLTDLRSVIADLSHRNQPVNKVRAVNV